jgi:tight adherence protein C
MTSIGLAVGLLGIFVGLALLLTTIGTITRERVAVGRSLAAIRAMELAPRSLAKELDQPFGDRVVSPGLDRLARIGRRFSPRDQSARLRRRLDLAGNPTGWDVDRVLAFKVLGLAVGTVIGLFVPLALGLGVVWCLLIAVGLAVLGWYAPDITLYQVGYNRTEAMRRSMPDALDVLTISVEAGLAFDAALAQVARNTDGPLAEEFFRVLQEMQLGTGRIDAMRALTERTNLPELKGFVTAMVQADSFGIPVANVLRVQSQEMRVRRSQRAEEIAQRIPVKILFPLIFCILPVLLTVILGPAVINIFESFSGNL